jgi:hypothetical protein
VTAQASLLVAAPRRSRADPLDDRYRQENQINSLLFTTSAMRRTNRAIFTKLQYYSGTEPGRRRLRNRTPLLI